MKVVDKKMNRKCAPADTDEDQQPIVFQMPFGKGTSEMKKSMKHLPHKINNKKIHMGFQTKKFGQYLSNKATTPNSSDANLIYKFKCQGCKATFIGQAKRHLRTRLAEHRQRSRESAIKDHLLVCDKRTEKLFMGEMTIVKKSFNTSLQRKY